MCLPQLGGKGGILGRGEVYHLEVIFEFENLCESDTIFETALKYKLGDYAPMRIHR
jgi:hypothetical protein